VTFQTTLEFPLTAEFASTKLTDLGELHRFVMGAAARTTVPSASPRAELGITFRLGLPGDDGVGANLVSLLVRSTKPLSGTSTTVVAPVTGTQVRARVTLVTEKRVSRGTGKTGPQHSRPLTDDESVDLAQRHLTESGLQVKTNDLRLSGQRKVGRKGAINFTSREVIAHATVTDQAALSRALEHGIGRGLNYGFGLLSVDE
jgi:hypothetical protein